MQTGLGCLPRRQFAAVVLAIAVVPLSGCEGRRGAGRAAVNDGGADQPWFVDAASESGLAFTHFNGMSGEFNEIRAMTMDRAGPRGVMTNRLCRIDPNQAPIRIHGGCDHTGQCLVNSP